MWDCDGFQVYYSSNVNFFTNFVIFASYYDILMAIPSLILMASMLQTSQ
jgi:hypothetical protein